MMVLRFKFSAFALLFFLTSCARCDRMEETLARDSQGRSVVTGFTACTNFGSPTEESVYLVGSSGRRETIFVFEPTGGVVAYKGRPVPGPINPEATWLSSDSLQITIGAVGSIVRKQDQVQGVHVIYKIGMILSDH